MLLDVLFSGTIVFTYLSNKLRKDAILEILSKLETLFTDKEIGTQNYQEIKNKYNDELQKIGNTILLFEKKMLETTKDENHEQRLMELYEQSKEIFGQYILDSEERKFEEKIKSLMVRKTVKFKYDIEEKK